MEIIQSIAIFFAAWFGVVFFVLTIWTIVCYLGFRKTGDDDGTDAGNGGADQGVDGEPFQDAEK